MSLSFGHAFVAPDHRKHRSSMSVQIPEGEQLELKGACAVIADSTWRNAIAKQAGDLSVRGFLADYFSTPNHWDVKTAATRVLRALNGWCFSQSRFVAGGSYISSLSAVVFRGRDAHLFHMGDTLVFRLRGAEFEQLSRDHVTDLGGYRYPSRALGMDGSIDIDYLSIPLKQGDIFLFTTQAVRGTLLPTDYVQLIRQDISDLDGACERLAKAASQRAAERGYGAEAFCFQMVRIDRLPEQGSEREPSPQLYGKLPIPPELEVGEQLDGYEVMRVISRTSKARIYLVKDRERGTRAVMKAPSPELSLRNAYLEHFIFQQWIAERIKSPFVIRVMAPLRPRRYLYYLMDYIEGDTLLDWVERHPQASFEQRLDIAGQLGKAVHTLHRRDVLHQGIRPENILVDQHGQVILADFGACARRDADSDEQSILLAREVGLSDHSAPEYALGTGVSRRSDQYGLASVIYWLLTNGAMPYEVPPRALRQQSELDHLQYRSARQREPAISERLDAALKRGLSPERALRYRRLSELLYALKLPAGDEPVADDDPPAKRRNLWHEPANIWQAIAGILLILLVLSWWLK